MSLEDALGTIGAGFDAWILVAYVRQIREERSGADTRLSACCCRGGARRGDWQPCCKPLWFSLLAEVDVVMALEAKLLRSNERVLALTQGAGCAP